ncbi:MAG: sigma-70 family RNA polymerase sigma factor [Pirellulaceae bacterium]|nr:sigma-70 family RNA polymerase sigma factor [Planctomycetales bacterium]
MDEPNEAELGERIVRGDWDAWDAFYDAYATRLWRYTARIVGRNHADVHDIVQNTFVEAARSAHRYDANRGTLDNWIWGIAAHQIQRHFRSQSRSELLARAVVDGGTRTADLRRLLENPELCPDEAYERVETCQTVRQTLASILPDYARLLIAKYLDNETTIHIAELTGQSSDAVTSKLARARRAFREKFMQLAGEVSETSIHAKVTEDHERA